MTQFSFTPCPPSLCEEPRLLVRSLLPRLLDARLPDHRGGHRCLVPSDPLFLSSKPHPAAAAASLDLSHCQMLPHTAPSSSLSGTPVPRPPGRPQAERAISLPVSFIVKFVKQRQVSPWGLHGNLGPAVPKANIADTQGHVSSPLSPDAPPCGANRVSRSRISRICVRDQVPLPSLSLSARHRCRALVLGFSSQLHSWAMTLPPPRPQLHGTSLIRLPATPPQSLPALYLSASELQSR